MTEAALFDLLLNTAPADRPAVMDRECVKNPALRDRLEKLLAADAESEDTQSLATPGTTRSFGGQTVTSDTATPDHRATALRRSSATEV